jgi:signal transduction histidine kinase
LQKLWEKDADLACLLLKARNSLNEALRAFQVEVCDRALVPLIPDHFSQLGTQDVDQAIHSLQPIGFQMQNLKKTVEWVLEKRLNTLELKRLRAFVQSVAPLWSVAAGEMDTSDLFDKDFLAPAAFRLTIAHEFRAPLTALQSFLLILLKGYVAPEEWKEIVQHALDRAQDMMDLVDDLMSLAAAKHEMSLDNRTHVRLWDELEKLAPSFKTETDERKLTLTLTVLQNPFVLVNPHHMGQLWTNLISNAIKYTPEGGKVRITLTEEGGFAKATVSDTGIGIKKDDLPRIFDKFYRVKTVETSYDPC